MADSKNGYINNLLRIADERQKRLDDIHADWRRMTKHMECGEYREYKQYCRDEETIVFILRKMAELIAERRADNG